MVRLPLGKPAARAGLAYRKVAAEGVLPDGDSRATAATDSSRAETGRLDQGSGVSQGCSPGRTAIRLCNLVAQAQELPKEEFKREVERHLTGQETEPWEMLYFKMYKSQLAVIEQALETASMMLGGQKARGYCLEMICADFLAGASLHDSANAESLLLALSRTYQLLPTSQRQEFLLRIPKAS